MPQTRHTLGNAWGRHRSRYALSEEVGPGQEVQRIGLQEDGVAWPETSISTGLILTWPPTRAFHLWIACDEWE